MARQPGSTRSATATRHPSGGADFVHLTFQLGVAVRRAFAERMAGEGWAHDANLRPGCFGVLRAVHGADGHLSQRDVAARTGIDPSDVVDLVDRLESAGLLRRGRDERDRRRHALALTPAGALAIERFRAVAATVAADVLAPLDRDERHQLTELLRRVVDTPGARSEDRRRPPPIF